MVVCKIGSISNWLLRGGKDEDISSSIMLADVVSVDEAKEELVVIETKKCF